MGAGIDKLSDFDYSLLKSTEFKEDSVREELIVPLIAELGYSAGGKTRVVRSKSLNHPYVLIGSKKKKVTITPDYLLYGDEERCWVLDAKHPGEAVDDSKHIAQVYSYAMHRDVRAKWFAICNGYELAVYHVSDMSDKAKLRFHLSEIKNYWHGLCGILGPEAVCARGELLKDWGLCLLTKGETENEHVFVDIPISQVVRHSEDLYSIQCGVVGDGYNYCATFDLSGALFADVLKSFSKDFADQLQRVLEAYPMFIHINGTEANTARTTLRTRLGTLVESKREHYVPLIVHAVG